MELVGGHRNHRLWVVRHGESTWNAQGRMQRQVAHPPLTARGTTQAYAAGYALQDRLIRRVVASDSVRALQTAQAMATVLGVDVVVDKRLRERGWSVGERLTEAQSSRPPRLEDPTARVASALTDIAGMAGATAVVTHGDIVCAILDMLGARDATSRHWTDGTDVPNGVVIGVNLGRLRRPADPP